MQQGNHNEMVELPQAAVQESFESETQNSEFDYDVVTQQSPDREFDLQTLDAFGVVSHSMHSADQCSDDETFQKEVVPADEFRTSSKRVVLPDETRLPASPQPLALQVAYNDRRQCFVGPADACGLLDTEAGVTVNSHCLGAEHRQIVGLSADNDADEDTVRKSVDFDMALQTADDGDDDDHDDDAADSNGEGQGPLSGGDQSVVAEADAAAGLTESQKSESVRHKSVTEDSCNTENLLNAESNSTSEAVIHDELQNATSVLPSSQSTQQESSVSSRDHDDPSADSNFRRSANIRSLLYSAVLHTTVCILLMYAYVNHYARL